MLVFATFQTLSCDIEYRFHFHSTNKLAYTVQKYAIPNLSTHVLTSISLFHVRIVSETPDH